MRFLLRIPPPLFGAAGGVAFYYAATALEHLVRGL